MNLSLTLLVITLVIAASSASISYAASLDSYLFQLQNGVDHKDIQCRDDLVLVLRTSDSSACVKVSSAEKLGWDIIDINFNWDAFLKENPVNWSDEKLGDKIIYEFPFTAEKPETTNDAIIDYSVPKLWYDETTLSISNFPKVGETAELTATFTNLSDNTTFDFFTKTIGVSDNFEIVESDFPITTVDSGYRISGPLNILETNQTDFMTITIKAIKEGQSRIGASGIDSSASINLMIGESQTLLYDDWEEKYPELALQKQRDKELADGRVWGTINGEMVILEIAELGDFDIYEERDGIGFDDLPEDVMRDELEQMGYSPKDIDEIIIEIQERKAQNRNTISPEDSIAYHATVSEIIYEFPLSSKTDKTNVNSEPGVWQADFEVIISNLPKIGETAEIFVTVTNKAPYHVNELYPDTVIGISITDNFEFVNIPTEQIRKHDKYGYLFYGEHLIVDVNGTQTLSATVKAVKSGMGFLGGVASQEYSYKPWVFVGEDQTLLRDDYYKLNPDEDPSNKEYVEKECTNEWCEPEPTVHPDEIKEYDGVGPVLVSDEEMAAINERN